MTGVISATLATFSVAILVIGTFAAIALNSVTLAIAVTGASFCALGLFAAQVRLRRRFRYPRVRSPRHGLRILPPWEWQIWLTQVRGEARAARPRWTDKDRQWLEENQAALPETRGRWR